MNLLPTSLGTRPRLAVELRAEGVVAARAEDAQAQLTAVSHGLLPAGALAPGLHVGNIADRAVLVAAVKKALEAVALRERQATLILPDSAVRVLLLDFDALPAKAAEALPVVRFRLKKLLPFDADDAVVSYQVMSSARGAMRVLAVAVPKEIVREYESVVRQAGFEPGAVLPSTLAACAGLAEDANATLVVNAQESSVTTAIVQDGVLLLHRTVDLEDLAPAAPSEPAVTLLPLVDEQDSAGEWARQQPVNGYGMIEEDPTAAQASAQAERLRSLIESDAAREAQLTAERGEMLPPPPGPAEQAGLRVAAAEREVTQAVSVAAAYFEDTLQMAPGAVLAAGTFGAASLGTLLAGAGFGSDEIQVREMVAPEMLAAGASTTRVPAGWLAGVRGALRS